MKYCSTCDQIRANDKFADRQRNPDGKADECLICKPAEPRPNAITSRPIIQPHPDDRTYQISNRQIVRVEPSTAQSLEPIVPRNRRLNICMEDGLICTKCKEVKPLTEYSPDRHRQRGYRTWCRSCSAEAVAKYRKTEEYRQYQKAYHANQTPETRKRHRIPKNPRTKAKQ